MTPIVTQYGLKGHSQTGQNITFYNVQPKRTLALKGEKYQNRKGYEDTAEVFDISMLMAAKNHHSLIISKSEKQHCLKGLEHYPSD